jgi:hypothetical protein
MRPHTAAERSAVPHRLDAQPKRRPGLDPHRPRSGPQLDPGMRDRAQQRVEHGLGVVGGREVLPGLLELERHAQRLEPLARPLRREGA